MRRPLAARHFFKALFVLLALLFVPWALNTPSDGLDGSWVTVISHAFANGWQFGKDLVFTFGPYGFLYTKVNHPQTYGFTLAFWPLLAIALAVSVASFSSAEHVRVTVALFLVLLGAMHIQDAAFFLVPLLLLLTYVGGSRFLALALLALTAFIGLVKFTFALFGFAMVVLIEAHRLLNGRRVPHYLLSYVALLLLFFVLAGQDLRNFSDYISTSLEVAQGYSEAMQLGGASRQRLVFIAAATCFIALVLYFEARRERGLSAFARGRGLLLTSGLCLFVYMSFKAGFVRQDGYHVLSAWTALSAAAAVYAIFALPGIASPPARAALLSLCAMLAGVALAPDAEELREPTRLVQRVAGGIVERGNTALRIVRGKHGALEQARYAAAMQAIRDNNPLPRLEGPVDIFPWEQSALIAHGLDYRPRPVFQSYKTYTSALSELNRTHIRSDGAATSLLIDIKTIDDRFPSLDDGQLWPEIIARYDSAGMAGRYLLLRKRVNARSVALVPVSTESTTWSTPVDVPKDVTPVWLSIELRKTVFGSLLNVLGKLPAVMVNITLDNGATREFRVVPTMAREGFLLSPLVDTPMRFARLFDRADLLNMPGRVSRLEIVGSHRLRRVYDERIALRFAHLCIEPCRANAATPQQTDQVSEAQ